jgi:hypothetical protein
MANNSQLSDLISQMRSRVSDFMNSSQGGGMSREEADAYLEMADPAYRALRDKIRRLASIGAGSAQGAVAKARRVGGELVTILKSLGGGSAVTLEEAAWLAIDRLVDNERAQDPSLSKAAATAKVLKGGGTKPSLGAQLYDLTASPFSDWPVAGGIEEIAKRDPGYFESFLQRAREL